MEHYACNKPFPLISNTVTAVPRSNTRSPAANSHSITPVRFEAWKPTSAVLSSFFPQYGARYEWADPVTGSSLMP
jgi:hypothetical protein